MIEECPCGSSACPECGECYDEDVCQDCGNCSCDCDCDLDEDEDEG